MRTAVEIVRAYGVDAWTEGRDDLIPELCHDPIIRHDAEREVRLSHAEQRARMRLNYEELRPVFEDVVLAGDDEHVTLVWNVTGRDPNWKWCGIEVFRVVDGRIAEVWNSTYMDGRWGLSKSLSARIGGGKAVGLPLVRCDLVRDAGRVRGDVVVPTDASAMAWWLAALFGRPESQRTGECWEHRFASGGDPAELSLAVIDEAGPSFDLTAIDVPSITVAWERSGLINAVVAVTGEEALASQPTVARGTAIRLAETTGSFTSSGIEGRVAEAAITLSADGTASGHVALGLADPEQAAGKGRLSLEWRNGDQRLVFAGEATLSAPTGAFVDGGAQQARYEWRGQGFTATLVNDQEPLDHP